MLASRPCGTLYPGVTHNLGRRIVEPKAATIPGFSALYGVHPLVWMEDYDLMVDAIAAANDHAAARTCIVRAPSGVARA